MTGEFIRDDTFIKPWLQPVIALKPYNEGFWVCGSGRVESLFVYFQSRPTISVTFGRKNTAHKYRKNILEGTISRWQMEKCVSGELLRDEARLCHDPAIFQHSQKARES